MFLSSTCRSGTGCSSSSCSIPPIGSVGSGRLTSASPRLQHISPSSVASSPSKAQGFCAKHAPHPNVSSSFGSLSMIAAGRHSVAKNVICKMMISVPCVIKSPNLSTTCLCPVFLQDKFGLLFFKSLAGPLSYPLQWISLWPIGGSQPTTALPRPPGSVSTLWSC